MALLTPDEITAEYIQLGVKKVRYPPLKTLLLSILAGLIIAFGAAATSTVSHNLPNASLVRLASGLLFPFGLCMVMMTGAELFTGNCLIFMSVLDRSARTNELLRNWALVYFGNILGALLLAALVAFGGQLDQSDGGLAIYSIALASAKCRLPFLEAIASGFLCNVLVCLGVLIALAGQDAVGRIIGAYIPVALFVLCGFEHSVANMYYIPAGLFALALPKYAVLALEAGIDATGLTVGRFLLGNLLPVTIGNILGGVGIGTLFYAAHRGPWHEKVNSGRSTHLVGWQNSRKKADSVPQTQ